MRLDRSSPILRLQHRHRRRILLILDVLRRVRERLRRVVFVIVRIHVERQQLEQRTASDRLPRRLRGRKWRRSESNALRELH